MKSKNRIKFTSCGVLMALGFHLGTAQVAPGELPDPDGNPADMSKPVQVYIMLGQSNMLGFGKVSGGTDGCLDYAVNTKGKYPYLVDGVGNWTERKDVRYTRVMGSGTGAMSLYNNEWLNVASDDANIGVEYGIGHHLGHAVDAPVLLLKSCIGNRSLGWDLLPPGSTQYEFNDGGTDYIYAGYQDSPDRWVKGTTPVPISWYAGTQYDGDIARAKAVLADIGTYYPGATDYEIAGFFWWQGDKDRYNAGHATRYEQNLVQLIEQLRVEFNAPDANFVLATLGQTETGAGGNDGVILDAQLAVDGDSGEHPAFAGNVATVYSHPLSQGGASNGHYNGNAETYMNIGEAMGIEMTELLVHPCPYGLKATSGESGVMLTWKNGDNIPTSVRILRNAVEIAAAAPVDPPTYLDATAPDHGLMTYTLVPAGVSCDPLIVHINLNTPVPGGAVIYEPFDYPPGGLNGQFGGTELSFENAWSAHVTALVANSSLTYGSLPATGGHLAGFRAGEDIFGGQRLVKTSVLNDRGLLADGAVLWFSALMGIEAGADLVNVRLLLALASDPFSSAADESALTAGEGIGVYLARGRPYAAFFGVSPGITISTSSGAYYPSGGHGLVVGKITWGATPNLDDTLELFQPDTDLNLGAPVSSVRLLVNQSSFDTLTFRRVDKPLLDEIRLGATYESVIGAGTILPLSTGISAGPEGLILSWGSRTGIRYNVWSSPDMTGSGPGWSLVNGNILPTPPDNVLPVLPSGTHSFFMVEEFPAD